VEVRFDISVIKELIDSLHYSLYNGVFLYKGRNVQLPTHDTDHRDQLELTGCSTKRLCLYTDYTSDTCQI